jgi:hypothetical protein
VIVTHEYVVTSRFFDAAVQVLRHSQIVFVSMVTDAGVATSALPDGVARRVAPGAVVSNQDLDVANGAVDQGSESISDGPRPAIRWHHD